MLLNGVTDPSPATPQTRTLRLYSPHEAQRAVHQSTARYRVAAWGRQSGKSTCCLNELAFKAWANPNHTYWFVSPTFEQARVQYRRFVGMLMPCREVMNKKNQTELRVKLVNQSSVCFKSGEVGDNLRGETLNGVVIDEVRDQPSDLWSLVIRPMLATTNGWALFASTPRGFDSFCDLFERAKTDPDWDAFHAPSTANPLFTQEEYESAQAAMSEDEFAQEILAEFREMGVGKVYKNHGTWNQETQNPFASPGQAWSRHLPLVVGLDFNVGLMCWEISQFRGQDSYTGDEIAVSDTNTQECAPFLLEKVRGHPSGVILIGDASGEARRSSATSTDYGIIMRILKDGGVRVSNKTPEANPPVLSRINICNTALKDAAGIVHARYHPGRCQKLKRDLERVLWRQGTGGADLDKRDPLLTHASDAWGYPHCFYSESWKPKPGRMRVLVR